MSSLSRIAGAKAASPVLSGLLWSGLWLAAGALLLSALLASTSMKETDLLPWVFGVHSLAALAGGFVSARRSGRKGWYFGAANGLLYMLIVLLVSFLATDADWSLRVPSLLGLTVFGGMLGGMLGVGTGSGSGLSRK